MSDYKYTASSVEIDRVNDILMTQKHLTGTYNNASNEVDCNALHNEVLNILKEEHEMEHQVYEAMKKRGWYSVKQANTQDAINLYNEFNNKKKDVGIR